MLRFLMNTKPTPWINNTIRMGQMSIIWDIFLYLYFLMLRNFFSKIILT